MTIESIFPLVLAGGCLFALGMYLGSWTRPGQQCKPELDLEFVDDNGLFCGWDGFTAIERKQRLALYQRRIRARIAEQERAWLRVWLKESVAAGNEKNEVSSQGAGDRGGLASIGISSFPVRHGLAQLDRSMTMQ